MPIIKELLHVCILVAGILFIPLAGYGQSTTQTVVEIPKMEEPIQLEGQIGEEETYHMTGNMLRMVQQLESRNYKGLNLNGHIFEDQDYYGVLPTAMNMGLLKFFDDENT